MDKECICDCRYCLVYEVGVYVVDGAWLAIMLFVIIVYFREIKAYFKGRLKRIEPYILDPPKSESRRLVKPSGLSPDAMSISPMGGGELEPVSPFAKTFIPVPPRREILRRQATQVQLQGPAQAQPGPYQSPLARAVKTPQPTRNTALVEILLPDTDRPATPPPPAAPKSPLTAKKGTPDKFALPKKQANLKHESTGSDYFNTMLEGKKPVASISQYMMMQRQAKDQRHREHKRGKRLKMLPEDVHKKNGKVKKEKEKHKTPS